MTEPPSKPNPIGNIVRLRDIIKKWQAITMTHRVSGDRGISPATNRRLKNIYLYCDSDEESCPSPDPPPDVPKGYLAVYVGPELRRFVIPTDYLTQPVFKVLLEKAEEEFGFYHKGALTIPCEIETFKYLLRFMAQNHKDEEAGT
ncbi:auxin-responsive protein SAUR50 [Amborella trichopoda]|uniref:Uncharacterized protein n=1 Tax=Amborella trichopoda TaxID=13333 RepID=W1P6K7_AMBTC|nr:auxin-responsive protein SAUR50 [Amborella trichopoda]ERN05517.1 hypothetical protein AMTR_s00007p00261250 [Amborella trichopoda]|eukprot:XP_006843842.1 auxin-responsive protein SAUR50 [Amborella trichopoda]